MRSRIDRYRDASNPHLAIERPAPEARLDLRDARLVGAASADITPRLGRALAGWGPEKPRQANGRWGPLMATVLLGASGESQPPKPEFAVVVVDLLAGSRWIAERVCERLRALGGVWEGFGVERLFLASSHTHSGPGNVFGTEFYDNLASYFRGFDLVTADWIAGRLVTAMTTALGSAQEGAWRLSEVDISGMLWQRSMDAFVHNAFLALGRDDKREARFSHEAARTRERSTLKLPGGEGCAPMHGEEAARRIHERDAVDPRLRVLSLSTGRDATTLVGAIAFCSGTSTVFAMPGAGVRGDGREPLPSYGQDVYTGDAYACAARFVRRQLGVEHVAVAAAQGFGDTNVLHPGLTLDTFVAARVHPHTGEADGHARVRLARDVGYALGSAIVTALGSGTTVSPCALAYGEPTVAGARTGEDWREEVPGGTQRSLWGTNGARKRRYRQATRLGRVPRPGYSTFAASEFSVVTTSAADAPHTSSHGSWLAFYEGMRGAPGARHGAKPRLLGLGDRLHRLLHTRDAALLPPVIPLRALRFGPATAGDCSGALTLIGLPFEPSTGMVCEIAACFGPNALMAGNCGDYHGYVTTIDEYQRQNYEGASTLWGRNTHPWLVEQLRRVYEGLTPTRQGQSPSPRHAQTEWPRRARDRQGVAFTGGFVWFDDVTGIARPGEPTSVEWRSPERGAPSPDSRSTAAATAATQADRFEVVDAESCEATLEYIATVARGGNGWTRGAARVLRVTAVFVSEGADPGDGAGDALHVKLSVCDQQVTEASADVLLWRDCDRHDLADDRRTRWRVFAEVVETTGSRWEDGAPVEVTFGARTARVPARVW